MARLSGTATVDFTVVAEPGEPEPIPPPGDNTITLVNRTGAPVADYPLMFGRPFCAGEIKGVPSLLVDGAPIETQAEIKNRHPDGSAAFAVIAVVMPDLPPDTPVVVALVDGGVRQAPHRKPTMPQGFDVVFTATGETGEPQAVGFADAIDAGLARVWTSGPVAQSVTIADDSADRCLDIGFGDMVLRPLRLRAGLTHWPELDMVQVRVTGEAVLTTELSDLAYEFAITAGDASDGELLEIYRADLLTNDKRHWAMSRWTRTFWWPQAPPAEIDIDWNLAYLAATRWVPNYNPAITLDAAAIEQEWRYWSDRPHDIYDGQYNGGLWQNAMGVSGERQEIGPLPTWDVMSLYSGDWRLREMARGMADLAAAFPGNLREGDPAMRLARSDSAPGSGLGRAVSIADRQTLMFGQLDYSYTKPEDRVTFVGPRASQPWSFDQAHQPQPWLVPYLLTGDPFYLDSAYLWAGSSAAFANGAAATAAYGRGPTGAEGVLADQLRGGGWGLRGRVETWLMAPDADPEKAWLATLARDALARWEGGFEITGTDLDGDPCKTWGDTYGNYYTSNNGPCKTEPPILHNWESNGNPTADNSTIKTNEADGIYVPGAVGSFTSPWMQFYVIYALGRALELGFPAGPLLEYSGRWLIELIAETGHPMLVAQYQSPVEKRGGGFFDWPAFLAALEPAWLTGEGWVPPHSNATSLPQYWAQHLHADGRQAWGLPAASYLTRYPGGADAWAWLEANLIAPIATSRLTFAQEPKWAILPR